MKLIYGYTFGDWSISVEYDGEAYHYFLNHLSIPLIHRIGKFTSETKAAKYFIGISELHLSQIENGITPSL